MALPLQLACMMVACLLSAALGFHMGGSRANSKRLSPFDGSASVALPLSSSASVVPVHERTAWSSSSAPLEQASLSVSSQQTAARPVGASAAAFSEVLPAARPNQPASPRPRIHAFRAPPAPKVPLVFFNIDPVAVGLTSLQVADIDRMRTQFTEQVGKQAPSDPAYRERWASAQADADEQLRAYLGWDQFNQYQIHAAQAR